MHQLYSEHPDSGQKSRLFPSRSTQVCEGRIRLCKLTFSGGQTHLACDHYKKSPLKPEGKKKESEFMTIVHGLTH